MISNEMAEVKIPFLQGEILSIVPDGGPETLLELPIEEARRLGEEHIQLQESCSYDYVLPEGFKLGVIPCGIVHESRRKNHSHTGHITPGIFVGRLSITILKGDSIVDEVAVEVRSIKTDYRTDYRKMLEDITSECTDLLMIHSSPATQRFATDYEGDSRTLYQRFAFVKAVIDSEDFRNAVQRVIAMPVRAWSYHLQDRDIRRARRISAAQLRQVAARCDRIKLPCGHPLKLHSVPARLTSEIKIDTLDTPENRFVKHALQEFGRFCGLVRRHAEKKQKPLAKLPQIYKESRILEERFEEVLNHSMFREISAPTTLPLNSPVLQRKEGYREILRVWLMFDLAAKLIWEALDDDYQAGKRDVATLYEYWLFFKLLGLIQEVFSIKPKELEELIQVTKDGLGLQLKAGKQLVIKGRYFHSGRNLKVQFAYNRTFGISKYPKGGSWTKQMRPDYTLSIWPAEFDLKVAEEQELIVHLHFDAKYKVEGLKYLLSGNEENLSPEDLTAVLDSEKEEQKRGTYKRADLLKMHAYKDAIRRTVGAYVLYPGNDLHKPYQGFHEIIPGLGAFPIAPQKNGEDLRPLRAFIEEVVEHFVNRASQREASSYHQYNIHKNQPLPRVDGRVPELFDYSRMQPLSEVSVLVGYYQEKQYPWIKKQGKYNIRILKDDGLIEYSEMAFGAKYILLYGQDTKASELWKVTESPPVLITKNELAKMGYTGQGGSDTYFLFSIEPVEDSSFGFKQWDVTRLQKYKKNNFRPFTTDLAELMTVVNVSE